MKAKGVQRKGAGRGYVFRWREYDHAKGKIVQRTSQEFDSERKAAAARSNKLTEIKAAAVASRRPTREGITIEKAWASHPSTLREPKERREKYRKMLRSFSDHAGYVELRKLTYTDVADWVGKLIDKEFTWHTRCHYLVPLRRAARMAVTVGLPDVLAELKIDERPDVEHEVQAWTLDELAKAWHTLADKRRARVALGLGAFIGLRPSEIYRLRCGDLRSDGRLAIGLRQSTDETTRPAKNRSSRRLLPVPAILLAEIRDQIGTRAPTAPLLATASQKPKHFNDVTLAEWLGPLLTEHTGRRLGVKYLRKSFATWTLAAGLDFYHIEVYMGRETPFSKSITGQRYVADLYDLMSRQLDPTAQRINDIITQTIAKNGAQNGAHSNLGHT